MIKSIFKNCFIALLVIFSFSSYSFGKNAIEKANEFLLDIGLIEGLNTLKKGDIFVTLGAGSTILKSLCDSAKQLNLGLNNSIGNSKYMKISIMGENEILIYNSVLSLKYKITTRDKVSNLGKSEDSFETKVSIDKQKLQCLFSNYNLKTNFSGNESYFLEEIKKISKLIIFTSDEDNINTPDSKFAIIQVVKTKKWRPK